MQKTNFSPIAIVATVIGLILLLLVVVMCNNSQQTQTPIVITATPPSTAVLIPLTVTPQGAPTALPPTAQPPTAQPPTGVPPTGCPGAPVIESFIADPATIIQGQFTTLRWGKVQNATLVTIDQAIGGVATPGQTNVSPIRQTTYTMIANGCGGQIQRSVTVNVNSPTNAPPPTNPVKPTNPPPPTSAPTATKPPPTQEPPTKEPPTNTPEPTATTTACATKIQNVQASAPANPGTAVNVAATECYGGENGSGVVVVAMALDDRNVTVSGTTVPSTDAGINTQKNVNLTITFLLGAQPVKSYQVQVCFQSGGQQFGCVKEPFVMNWE